jgi:hypothetical protein
MRTPCWPWGLLHPILRAPSGAANEIRAEALPVYLVIAQIFGAIGPAFYGFLICNGSSRTRLATGYAVGGAIMILGGIVEILFGINAEGKRLEKIATPLTEVD